MGVRHGQYANPLCFALPGAGGIGNSRFPYLVGPKFWNSDLALSKKFNISERQSLQFRFSAFNFMNHALTSFSGGDNNLKMQFNDENQVITGSTMVYPGNGVDTQPTLMSCQQTTRNQKINGVQYGQDGIRCAGTSTFGDANYHYGHRIVELSVKYTF
jgi:hypothetical protein